MARPLLFQAGRWSLITVAVALVLLLWITAAGGPANFGQLIQHPLYALLGMLFATWPYILGLVVLIQVSRWARELLGELRAIRRQLEILTGRSGNRASDREAGQS